MKTITINNTILDALDYVRRELGIEKLVVVRAQRNAHWSLRLPIITDYDDEIHDLLEEWGEEHGLSEEWWSAYVEFDDILEII